jgi:hypothetical protein
VKKGFGTLRLTFEEASSFSTLRGTGARQAVRAVEDIGGRFLIANEDRKPPCFEQDLNPLGRADKNGNFLVSITLEHPVLARSPLESEVFKAFHATASFSYLQDSRNIDITQPGDADAPDNLDAMAHGQLALGRLLYGRLRPALGYVDEMGANAPGPKTVRRSELRSILWATFWGTSYVEKYGRSFLLAAPGWKREELDDGGILYVATESYFEWWTKPPKEVETYFQTRVPGVKVYRAKRSSV